MKASVDLPEAKQPDGKHSRDSNKHTAARPSGYTILVVDDQEEVVISVRLLLEREGHYVLTAASGEEALALFRHHPVHLIIVDYFMPRMSGEKVVQEIRKLDQDVQILLQTGYSGGRPPLEILRALAIQGYHDKTEGPDRLLLWVEVALRAAVQLKKVREIEQEVAESRAQLCRLSVRLLRLQEEEQERISRELHDHLGQFLTAIGMDVEWAQNHCPEGLIAVRERLQEAAHLVQETSRAIRELCATLRPEGLSSLGLEAALKESTAEFERRSGLLTRFSSHLIGREVPPEIAMHIYRIVQEALNNVARHAAATKVTVDLRYIGSRLVVSVRDNGKGFEKAKVSDPHTLGLVGMQERAQLVGGTLEVRSVPGEGTSVQMEVPITEPGETLL